MITTDIIVVGGGHAGVEAALAAARLGFKTILFTLNKKYIASTPCNPSIGGPAKGVVVREIDALGGEMAKNTDKASLQIKMLNTAKGPGVQCLRAQIDKPYYSILMQNILEKEKNLQIVEEMVVSLKMNNDTCIGIISDKNEYLAKCTILTTGTYMESTILVGHTIEKSGPDGEKFSTGLSKNLSDLGIQIFRLKTGTPPRILKSSIDFSKMKEQKGSEENLSFSYSTKKFLALKDQISCHLIHTQKETKKIIIDNLKKSAMYGGTVKGIGPRYCPSIEDKIVRFSEKEQHQLFLEPESKFSNNIYLQGFATSMPIDVQNEMVKSLPGLENAIITKHAYAIEYDAIVPTQLWPSLEFKTIKNLFSAGQINGTSGYEEAAGQGLIAGINAVLKIQKKEPLILRRDESYIGVMIDDLVTKGTKEPYRLLTSRAEYRLLLRHDNADLRLKKYGYNIGLINEEKYKEFIIKKENIKLCIELLKTIKFKKQDPFNIWLNNNKLSQISTSSSAFNLLKRPEIKIKNIISFAPSLKIFDNEVTNAVEIKIKYEGYINKQKKEAENNIKLEKMILPIDLDYQKIDNLALEARQKLNIIKPINISQASRISGVNPSDISILLMYLKTKGKI